MGQVTVSAEARIAAEGTLEIRAFPDDGQSFDPATANLSDRGGLRRESWDLARIELPFVYQIGGNIGHTDHKRWRLVAWIAGPEDVQRPARGAWYGTRLFDLNECGMPFSGYCGMAVNVDSELDHRY